MSEWGYAGKILVVDLTSRKASTLPTSAYASRFLGGRGIAAKIYWDMANPEVKALEPENCLIFITGPLAGFTRLAGCRWQIYGKSPEMEPEHFSYANLGGSWGAWLKYAGYDGLVVTGRADRPVYVYIDDAGSVEIKDASKIETFKQEHLKDRNIVILSSSDSHHLENLQSPKMRFQTEKKDVSGILECIKGEGEGRIIIKEKRPPRTLKSPSSRGSGTLKDFKSLYK